MISIECIYPTKEAVLQAFSLLYKNDTPEQYIRDMGMFESV